MAKVKEHRRLLLRRKKLTCCEKVGCAFMVLNVCVLRIAYCSWFCVCFSLKVLRRVFLII